MTLAMDHGRGAEARPDIVSRAKALLNSSDPNVRKDVEAANAALRAKALTPGALHNDSTLSNVSVQYRNEEFIGLRLMPVVTVSKLSDKYFIYSKRDRMAGPDATIGPRGRANEVFENRSTDNYSCESYALENYVDQQELSNQDAPLNEMVDSVAAVNDTLDLLEEQRIAAIMTASAS